MDTTSCQVSSAGINFCHQRSKNTQKQISNMSCRALLIYFAQDCNLYKSYKICRSVRPWFSPPLHLFRSFCKTTLRTCIKFIASVLNFLDPPSHPFFEEKSGGILYCVYAFRLNSPWSYLRYTVIILINDAALFNSSFS